MDGPRDYHTKWSKPYKDIYHMISLMIYMESKRKKKTQMNLFPKQKETHRHRKQTLVTKGERGVGEGIN